MTTQAAEPVRSVRRHLSLDYDYVAPYGQALFLRALARGEFVGQRCPVCERVFIGGIGFFNGVCPTDAVLLGDEPVLLSSKGTVTTYSTVEVPLLGQDIEVPYTQAHVLLDGADMTLMTILQEVDVKTVRMGMRVEAVFLPKEQLHPNLDSVKYFRPINEPDADYETFKEHC